MEGGARLHSEAAMRDHTLRRCSMPGLETHAEADLMVRCHFLPESRQTVAQPVQFDKPQDTPAWSGLSK